MIKLTVFLSLFALLFLSVLVWLYLCTRLFKLLQEQHPEKFVSMGEPHLTRNNQPIHTVNLLKFLFKKEWEALGDKQVMQLGQRMRVFAMVYPVCLFLLIGFGILGLE